MEIFEIVDETFENVDVQNVLVKQTALLNLKRHMQGKNIWKLLRLF